MILPAHDDDEPILLLAEIDQLARVLSENYSELPAAVQAHVIRLAHSLSIVRVRVVDSMRVTAEKIKTKS